jgi:GDP-L-fucose synthase
MMQQDTAINGKKIFVAGHNGMVGSAIVRRLSTEECDVVTAGRDRLDLIDQRSVQQYLSSERPDIVVIAAAKVGGILANSQYPVDFLYNNLMIATNVIEAAHRSDVNRILFLGSSCIYPKFADQPIVEESLLTGPLEATNEWYAIAKIAGIKLAEAYRAQYGRDYISAMPTNLYGPGDNFDATSSHVLPALIRKAHEAKVKNSPNMTIWGSGAPRREFLHAEDCADACIFLLNNYHDAGHINVGAGADLTIHELAVTICEIVGFKGEIICDKSMPDGTPRKLMDSSKLHKMGWAPKTRLEDGISATYRWYLEKLGNAEV